MIKYWSAVFAYAWRSFRQTIMGGWGSVVGFALQSAALFAVLYFIPWLGDVADEARLAGASSAAILGVGALKLVWEFLKAPMLMNLADQTEVARLSQVLRFQEDANAVRSIGLAIYEEWIAAMPSVGMAADYEVLSLLEAKADQYVADHYEQRSVMSYRYGTGYHVEAPAPGSTAFFQKRLDSFHSLILSYSTMAEENIYQFRPKDWTRPN